MEKLITVQICAPERVLPGYPMSGHVFEDFIIKGFSDGRKSFGAVSYSASVAAGWLTEFLNT